MVVSTAVSTTLAGPDSGRSAAPEMHVQNNDKGGYNRYHDEMPPAVSEWAMSGIKHARVWFIRERVARTV